MQVINLAPLFRNAKYLLAVVLAAAAGSPGWAQKTSSLQKFEATSAAMGVQLKIVVYASDRDSAGRAVAAGRQRVEELEQILSNYRADSEISRLARDSQGQPVPVSDDLWTVLQRSRTISEQTGGRFDITLAPLTDLWRQARQTGRLPSASMIDEARQHVGYQKIQMSATGQTVSFPPGVRLDFGGIGKGYAADQALQSIRASGIASALVELGGDMAIGGPPPQRPGWKIAVASPQAIPGSVCYLTVSDCGVASSGDTQQFVEIGGVRYSHLVDPQTGQGIQRSGHVTVVANDATDADAYASALSVPEPETAVAMANAVDGVEVLLQMRSGDGQPVSKSTARFPVLKRYSGR